MKHLATLFLFLLLLSCGSRKEIVTEIVPEADSIATQKITLLFVGDFMQHQTQINAARTPTGYDYSDYFQYVKEEISSADIAIGNLEVTLGGKPYRGYPMFSAPDEYLTAIKDAGFDILLTANNHCLDRRRKGLERTIHMLDSLRIPYAGTYINKEERNRRYPLLIEQNGFRLSMLNYTYGTNGLEVDTPNIVNYIDKDTILDDIRQAKAQQPDAIIACMHWGFEYHSLPNKEQKDLANWLLENGVTHVIGAHPHVPQPMELRTDSVSGEKHVISYSLGNFISNMSDRRTDGGVILKMELTKDSITRVSDCKYGLVWVAKPNAHKRKTHTLIPASYPTDSLTTNERNLMKIFMDDSRALFEEHNKEISEYTF